MANVLEEYLVKLGFYRRAIVSKVRRSVGEGRCDGRSACFRDAQVPAESPDWDTRRIHVGISAIVGMADKVAMADQSYRLLGLKHL